MEDLARWLGEQLDEDERIARAATPGPWRAHDTHLGQYGYAATVLSGEGNDTDLRAWLPSMSNEPWDEARNVWADAAHIAAHDPARVLREIDAKRALLNLYVTAAGWVERGSEIGAPNQNSKVATVAYLDAVKAIAAVYEDRPGYAEAVASAA